MTLKRPRRKDGVDCEAVVESDVMLTFLLLPELNLNRTLFGRLLSIFYSCFLF